MLECSLTDKNARALEMVVKTVKDIVLKAILAKVVNLIKPRIELILRSMSASSVSITASSECVEQVGIFVFFDIEPNRNTTFHDLIVIEDTRGYIFDECVFAGQFFSR